MVQYETRSWGRESLGEILSDIADEVFWGPAAGGFEREAGQGEREAGSVKREAGSGASPLPRWGKTRGQGEIHIMKPSFCAERLWPVALDHGLRRLYVFGYTSI